MAKDKTRLLHVPRFRTLAFITGIAWTTGLRAASLTMAAELAAANRGEDTGATDFAITTTLVRICAPETTDSLCVSDCSRGHHHHATQASSQNLTTAKRHSGLT